jgi:hypothetical protein
MAFSRTSTSKDVTVPFARIRSLFVDDDPREMNLRETQDECSDAVSYFKNNDFHPS